MIPSLRQQYNKAFTDEKYQAFLKEIYDRHDHAPNFRIAETPIFVPNSLKERLFEACEEISQVIMQPDFKEKSQKAVVANHYVPGEDDHTLFLQMDFGICLDENGDYLPQLIEVQGFPSLYFFQEQLAKSFRNNFDIPENYAPIFGGLSSEEYMELLRKAIVGDSNPENVILLEVEPKKQNTQIDFWECRRQIGIPILCVSELITEGKDVFYKDESGKKIQVEKIFNRVIFDELIKRDDLKREFYLTKEYNIKWIGHPHWFFRISKFTLPLIDSKYNPPSHFLNELESIPEDLHNYVLKPLYSFAGSGVIINLNRHDIEMIKDPENYILQKKVTYAPVLKTPTGSAKIEIRMLMLWDKDDEKPRIVNNLTRISKGEMIGVKYNKDKDWVGASVSFFQ